VTIEERIGRLLVERGRTLATAESCSGGLLAQRITSVPGSSAYYLGGVVAYANEAKERLLGVRHETLVAHGAVSEQVAREMAQGARRRLGADIGLSVTGIAGPSGGTPQKPVGLVYIALSAAGDERCQRHIWPGDRLANNKQSVEAVLGLVEAHLAARGKREAMEFVNEAVSVEVRLREGQSALPLAFVWRGGRYQIESWGREGDETYQGRTWHCHLVQTAGPETWELCRDTETAQWMIARHWTRNYPIV